MLETLKELIVSSPSSEFDAFIQSAWQGENPQLPSFGKPGIFDYYGKNKLGAEQGRYRVPMGSVERSYHVQRETDGSFKVVDEGLFPYDGK